MASRLILILGGARSGKSRHAQNLAEAHAVPSVLFVATAEAGDDEMATRIAAHRAARPSHWHTLEEPRHLAAAIATWQPQPDLILVDCLTLWVSNLLLSLPEPLEPAAAEALVQSETNALLKCIQASQATWIIVSNEVGLGLVPPYPLGRLYRDLLGSVNQRLAAAADEVIFMVAGLPMRLKG
ncbi:bifunctional adenosylcobinamide kinase/adenosylcobinamide-phosphate guanylyltransferase [uncultured Thermanaerothrix sp.]|uniref:bifunctional adenosylcobinamide kinase/adenosylcobinamide-phosphate guanylyltransferase n=1 Tax=uncultured Thermanaerothrix sp. TaxID=1195149 RepID=UPI002607E570|nr:bifunctional adenosylcobinamide kinase/adenosylcobinamide-phosphate guanylyltransferase [uncultured Thermanaerothrix sp.]